MKITIGYHLKSKNARDIIDLKDYAGAIIRSVKKIFPEAWGDVYPDKFEITGSPEELTQMSKLQNMGRYISYNVSDLREHVTTYGNSHQLFKKIEPKSAGGRKR